MRASANPHCATGPSRIRTQGAPERFRRSNNHPFPNTRRSTPAAEEQELRTQADPSCGRPIWACPTAPENVTGLKDPILPPSSNGSPRDHSAAGRTEARRAGLHRTRIGIAVHIHVPKLDVSSAAAPHHAKLTVGLDRASVRHPDPVDGTVAPGAFRGDTLPLG